MLHDPFPLLCKDVDMEFQADAHQGAMDYGNPHINCGVWYARCSDKEHCCAIDVSWAWLIKLLAQAHEFGQEFLKEVLNDKGSVTFIESAIFPSQVSKEELNQGQGTRICNVPM
eukprot:Ihof_evm4s682 gene=Ihof_evmTU4s682